LQNWSIGKELQGAVPKEKDKQKLLQNQVREDSDSMERDHSYMPRPGGKEQMGLDHPL